MRRREVPITYEQLLERQRRYDQLQHDLIDQGILEPRPRDGHHVTCPGCKLATAVSYKLEPQQLACNAEQKSGKIGCGEPFELRAATPMHHIDWWPLDPDPSTCLVPAWHRDVTPDHPARAAFRELKRQFLIDIGVAAG